MTTILSVDDEPRYTRLIEANLTVEGFKVITTNHSSEVIELITSKEPDLVLLDVMMPPPDGFQLLDHIRGFSNLPIIMLTAKGEEADRVEGLNRGADDYIVKPFSADELLARVRAVLRRATLTESASITFKHGPLEINYAQATVNIGENPVMLSATEYRLLLQFSQNEGNILTAEELLTKVWGPEYGEDKEILWVCISRLRQKLEDNPKRPIHIVTRSGKGYTMPKIEN